MADLTFGPFALDTKAARLARRGREVRLRPQAIRALEVLAASPGRCVDYDELMAAAWRGVVVSRHTVDVTVAEVRRALGEYGAWLRHRKTGYAFEIPHSNDQVRLGWHLWDLRTREGFERALTCFQRAAVEEPEDFRAYQGQAACYMMLAAYGMRPGRDVFPLFDSSLSRAVHLTGGTPELRCTRGQGLHMFERRLEEAELELARAARESPGLALPHIGLTTLYATLGRLDEALESVERARRADPLHPALPATEVSVRIWRREFDVAAAAGARAVEIQPYVVLGRVSYGTALELSGRPEEALSQYQIAAEMFPDLPWLRAAAGACLACMDRHREARIILDELNSRRHIQYLDSYAMAVFRRSLGDVDGAFAELERGATEGCVSLFAIEVDPKADPLRCDRRFARFRSQLRDRRQVAVRSPARH
jgi:tetratricopeptide (TPR) repeat protein